MNDKATGVFACRSEYKPNLIAMTVLMIDKIDKEKGILQIEDIDARDGTPLIKYELSSF